MGWVVLNYPMHQPDGFFFQRAPFVRLLAALVAGILLQWYARPSLIAVYCLLIAAGAGLFFYFFIPLYSRYHNRQVAGGCVFLAFLSLGVLLAYHRDIRHDPQWMGPYLDKQIACIIRIEEPLSEKERSYKTVGTVESVIAGNRLIPVRGKLNLYVRKDSSEAATKKIRSLQYGSRILFRKPLQPAGMAGNPGGFDYRRYLLFKGITHQVSLGKEEFLVLPQRANSALKKIILRSREKIIASLRKYIPGSREKGLAEALLIGYKEDLDPELVQSYARTGVVHIIAISGMHLGLIYGMLLILLRPLQRCKKFRFLRPLLLIAGLWTFSLLAGAQASVLRSAFMFTVMIAGESLKRRSSIYNNLAVSAFLLLCIRPWWLWDAGFQLSYAAVLSIALFRQPVYHLFYIKNKLLDYCWKLNAVTLSAQILTLPLSIYHFHQFPNLFLAANLLAIPLSGVILLGEILVCSLSFFPAAALPLGKITGWLIGLMNGYIEKVEQVPFSLWEGLQVNSIQVIFLYGFLAGIAVWLIRRSPSGIKTALLGLSGFMILRSVSFLQSTLQQRLIIYNIPGKTAIGILQGRHYGYTGDSITPRMNSYLAPSLTLYRARSSYNRELPATAAKLLHIGSKKIWLIRQEAPLLTAANRWKADLLILAGNPRLFLKDIYSALRIERVVFTGSVSRHKKERWKTECDSLHIPWHDVTEQGAFVFNGR